MRFAPPDRKGVSSGLFNTTTNLGMVVGVTVIEVVFSAVAYDSAGPKGKAALTDLVGTGSVTSGFTHAYLTGALCCFLALVFSLLGRKRSSDGGPGAKKA
jgi:hypothetical protein